MRDPKSLTDEEVKKLHREVFREALAYMNPLMEFWDKQEDASAYTDSDVDEMTRVIDNLSAFNTDDPRDELPQLLEYGTEFDCVRKALEIPDED